ncbi:MAG TPA: nicotinate-nucleotide--dimethylbenzimidazole phosphoribosyltransferase [Candidatus Binatia bacterium]
MLLDDTVQRIRPLDPAIESEARRRLDSLTKPRGSLGTLEDLACRVAVIQRRVPPRIGEKILFLFAADHGITRESVSAYPSTVTAQMTYNFLRGGAAINILASQYGVEVRVVDVGVDHEFPPDAGIRNFKIQRATNNFVHGPAMSRSQAMRSIETGIRLVNEANHEKLFLVSAGEMGIGNTTSATAILCVLSGTAPRVVTGRGTGIDDETLERKIAVIERGIRHNAPDSDDPVDVLSKVGGFEIGAITGVILAAAAAGLPMVLDGFVCGAGALLACRLAPAVRGVLFASHLSAERGHEIMLRELKLVPLMDLKMRLGEGTGACIAIGLIEAAARLLAEMATFESAGVAGKL